MDSIATPTIATALPSAAVNLTTDAGVSAPTSGERRCENLDCNITKLVSMVPKRKTSQFVTEPSVMDKPLLINGFTTIFQVDGTAAKLLDLKNPQKNNTSSKKNIFRIVPNTHVHMTNYVVVDSYGESLRKINESDPVTMRKLLESQKNSADQRLKNIMLGHGASTTTTPTVASSGTAVGSSAATSRINLSAVTPASTSMATTAMLNPQTPLTTATFTSQSPLVTPQAQKSTASIQLPVRMHPNLKITAVASADSVAALGTSSLNVAPSTAPSSVPLSVPIITPVAISSLRSDVPTTTSIAAAGATTAAGTTQSVETVEKPVFDKMQAELQELRRTVALLAEAQAKSQQTITATSARAAKRPRQ